MPSRPRPTERRVPRPLQVGDLVDVYFTTSGGPASWSGVVADTCTRRGLALVVAGRRRRLVSLMGAEYVRVTTANDQRQPQEPSVESPTRAAAA